MTIILLLLALLGHTLLWVALTNRVHAAVTGRWANRASSAVCLTCLAVLPLGLVGWYLKDNPAPVAGFAWGRVQGATMLYLCVCWAATAVLAARWAWQRLLQPPAPVLRFHSTRSVKMPSAGANPAGDEQDHHFLVRLPGNEMLRLDLTERSIEVPRLPAALDRLSIVHLSDFHFTGRVGKTYFQEVVDHSNQLQPDLVALTGDLVDHADYIDWIPDTLGRLSARYGVYFILGNHDAWIQRIDDLRRVLGECGMTDLGGRWVQVEVRGEPVVLAGNELPWLAPAADLGRCPRRTGSQRPLRIVLSHSPDQFRWARAHDVDLLLAGHTHGGQIRIPLVGAIFTPSRQGVKYTSGVFYAPPTVMHVTRGISGQFPVRLNCPPEMAHLVLRCVPHGRVGDAM